MAASTDPALTVVKCKATKNPDFKAYRDWARELAARRSNDRAQKISLQRRDRLIQTEYLYHGATTDRRAEIATLINAVSICPDLPDNIAELADRNLRSSEYPTELAQFNALSTFQLEAGAYHFTVSTWQKVVDVLTGIILAKPPAGVQTSLELAQLELAAVTQAGLRAQECLDAFRQLQRDAPQDDVSLGPPSEKEMELAFDQTMTVGPLMPDLQLWGGISDNKLGKGGIGSTYVFITADSSGRLTDRVVQKVVELDEEDASTPLAWQAGDNKKRKRAAEPWYQSVASSRHRANNNIVAYRNWSKEVKKVKKQPKTIIKIYMAYCSHGSLAKVIENHAKIVVPLQTTEGVSEAMVPENFVWSTFHGLVAALCILKYDIKPDNVFLSLPRDDGEFPGYSKAELGDFGLAQDLTQDFVSGDNNPFALVPAGTQAFQAPETKGYGADADTGRPTDPHPLNHKVDSHSDVFGVGITIMTLMNCAANSQEELDEDGFRYVEYEADHFPPSVGYAYAEESGPDDAPYDNKISGEDPAFNSRAKAKYSAQLKRLILRCVEPNPDDRPEVDELFGWIKGYVQDPGFNKTPRGTSIEVAQATPEEVLTDETRLEKKFAIKPKPAGKESTGKKSAGKKSAVK